MKPAHLTDADIKGFLASLTGDHDVATLELRELCHQAMSTAEGLGLTKRMRTYARRRICDAINAGHRHS